MKPLNSGHLRVLKNLSVIERCSVLGGSSTKILSKHFVHYSRNVRYLGCPLLGGFTVLLKDLDNTLCALLLLTIMF